MTVVDVQIDLDALTMTMICELAAPPARAWQLWSDPRQLERWWGPPTYPATFDEHELTAGATCTYVMTGPEGDRHHGWWRIVSVDEPRSLSFEDGFAEEDGRPNTAMPVTTAQVTFLDLPDGGTRMAVVSSFPSAEALQQLIDMGMHEGMALAMGQMDAILEDAGV